MDQLYTDCLALYHTAFPGESDVFARALFDRYFEEGLRVILKDGRPASMLFSIPYPIVTEKGITDARYLYAVATHPDYRGQGLAKELLGQEAARQPVFLRPMSPSLFDFYEKAGFTPFSPLAEETGAATPADGSEKTLSVEAYLALRKALAPLPCCRPTPTFLSLYESGGGCVAYGEKAVALFERAGDTVRFKEYWGDPFFAPRLAGYLKAEHFLLRRLDPAGKPFGVGVGIPKGTAFSAALD